MTAYAAVGISIPSATGCPLLRNPTIILATDGVLTLAGSGGTG